MLCVMKKFSSLPLLASMILSFTLSTPSPAGELLEEVVGSTAKVIVTFMFSTTVGLVAPVNPSGAAISAVASCSAIISLLEDVGKSNKAQLRLLKPHAQAFLMHSERSTELDDFFTLFRRFAQEIGDIEGASASETDIALALYSRE